ncbi:hypothetical protein [Halorubellus salinus]|uniref:hypothetical protein n=1 Tax=Halorubellus salinus TaxID=755309 RepID=UPI001D07F28B|nr:hypothetical protein [Halorubellus salinus]
MQDSTQQDAPTQPERGADRNERALAADDQLDPVLPSLDDGVTLLDVDGRGVPVLQSLALDHLLTHDGPALWVDTAGCARTTTLARVAPTWRLLERVHVARGFTPYQHHAAVADVPDAATDLVARDDAVDAPALLVAPVVDGRYRDADDLPREHAHQLLARTLARLRRYADTYDAPVLLTRTGDRDATAAGAGTVDATSADAFADIVDRTADHRLRCERTAQGPRFVGDDAETLVYPQADGTLQTTLSYWRTVLHQRASAAGVEPAGATPAANADAASAPGPSAATTRFGDADGGLADGARGHGTAHEHLLSPWQHGR